MQQRAGRTGTGLVSMPSAGLRGIVLTSLGHGNPDATAVNSWGIGLQLAETFVSGLGRPPLGPRPMSEAHVAELLGECEGPGLRSTNHGSTQALWVRLDGRDPNLVHLGDDRFAEADDDLTDELERDVEGAIVRLVAPYVSGDEERVRKQRAPSSER